MTDLSRTRQVTAFGIAIGVAVTLAGCSNSERPAPAGAGPSVSYGNAPSIATTPSGQQRDQADVTFLDQGVLLRRQAVELADLGSSNSPDSRLRGLANRVKPFVLPADDDLDSILRQWGYPEPSGQVPGLLTDAQLNDLRALHGTAFDDQWTHDLSQNLEASTRACDTERSNGASQYLKTVALEWSSELHADEQTLSGLVG